MHVPVEGAIGGSVCTYLGAKARPSGLITVARGRLSRILCIRLLKVRSYTLMHSGLAAS